MNVKSIDVIITDTEDAPKAEESEEDDIIEGEVIQ